MKTCQYIFLKPKNEEALNVIAKQVVGENGLEDRVNPIGKPVITKDGNTKYSYTITTANRSQGVSPVFVAIFLLKETCCLITP